MGTLSGVWVEKPFSAYRGDAPYVFVCYAHEDSEAVFREIAWLNDYGVNVWYDEGISPGHEWREELAAAIQGCARMLFFVSPRSVVSEHCRRELNFAQEEGREVIAVHLEPTEMPAGLRLGLNNRQAIMKHELADEEFRKRLIRAAQGVGSPAMAPASKFIVRESRPRVGLALAAIALVTAAIGVWWLLNQDAVSQDSEPASVAVDEQTEAPEVLPNSIAVLPFDNLSPDPNNAYFAAGIHEEILNQLAKIRDLSVIARTTMLRYVDSDKTIPEIGRELKVGAVMEGSVRYAGNRVRITAQLIDVNSGAQLWSEAYEQPLEDIFGIQLAIATQIADTLEAEFSDTERVRVGARMTHDPGAYTHYLRAVSSWGNFSGTRPVLEALDSAIEADPQFATAIAFKSFVHTIEGIAGPLFFGPTFSIGEQWRALELAESEAQAALQLDNRQALAHVSLAWARVSTREWQAAFDGFDYAFSLNPNDYFVANNAAWASLHRGNADLAIKRMERSVELNPGDFANQNNYAGLLYWAERYEDCERQAALVTKLAPESAYGFASLALAKARLGDVAGVVASAAMLESRAPSMFDLALAARALGLVGESEEANRIFHTVGVNDESRSENPHLHYLFRMAVQDFEGAIEYLEQTIDEGWVVPHVVHLYAQPHHPEFDPIRTHPRFRELAQRVRTSITAPRSFQ